MQGSAHELKLDKDYSSYLWSPGGEATPTKKVTEEGTYSCTVTDTNGCTGTASMTISYYDIEVAVTPNPLDFGSVKMNDPHQQNITIHNDNAYKITVEDVTFSDPAFTLGSPVPFDIQQMVRSRYRLISLQQSEKNILQM